jgi:superfamily I DNA/RNA helicase
MPLISDESDVQLILDAMPCSVELPAGCGKTQTISRLACSLSLQDKRSLVLTHTHAGVDALRRRLKTMSVPSHAVSVRTIDSWALDLVRHYPVIGGMHIPDEPDWHRVRDYYDGAKMLVQAPPIARMLKASYDALIVDEYQDCQRWQHDVIRRISQTLPGNYSACVGACQVG